MKVKVHEIIDPKQMATSLHYAYLDKNDFVATNSHAIVVHSSKEIFGEDFLKPLGDTEVLIPIDCLKQMFIKNSLYHIKCLKTNEEIDYYIEVYVKGTPTLHKLLINKTHYSFPNYNVVFPATYDTPLDKIGVDPKKLYQLQQAIDPNSLSVGLYFSGDSRAIGVKVNGSDIENYKALIMPVMLDY